MSSAAVFMAHGVGHNMYTADVKKKTPTQTEIHKHNVKLLPSHTIKMIVIDALFKCVYLNMCELFNMVKP